MLGKVFGPKMEEVGSLGYYVMRNFACAMQVT
jgi:hypothetical protein